MSHGIILDIVTILVMSVAVYYAVSLNRSLMRARDGRVELTQLIANLSEALNRADVAVRTMKVTASDYELSLQKQIAVSRGLIDELSFINDTSNALANRLERLASLARGNIGDPHIEATEKPPTPLPTRPQIPLRAERPGLITEKALETKPAPQPPKEITGMGSRNVHDLPRAARSSEDQTPRSKAERELFDALETLRKGRPS